MPVAVLAIMAGSTRIASAHAFSIGFTNAGVNSATVWLGTYPHGVVTTEGSARLQGVSGAALGLDQTIAFSLLTTTKPPTLVDGTNNFFVSTPLGVPGPLVGSDTIWLTTLCPACGPADHWQGSTFTGLLSGTYKFSYVPVLNPTQEWFPYNSSLEGTFDLTNIITPPVPEPVSILLMGMGLAAVAVRARRRKA